MPQIDSLVPAFAQGQNLALKGLTVLLIEDSLYASDGLRRLAMSCGARLRRAETLAQGRLHLATYRPDVVMIDIGLPDGSGLELIKELTRYGIGVPVVLAISGDPDLEDSALSAGAAAFLAKPILRLDLFELALLRHLPGRERVSSGRVVQVNSDRLALAEDLSLASQMLSRRLGEAQRCYLARFLGGIARETEDDDLAQAAQDFGEGQAPEAVLSALLSHRISAVGGAFGAA